MRTRFITIAAVAASLSLLGAACSSDDSSSSAPAADTTEPAMAAEMTITDVVASNPDFSTLLAAVQAADLGDTLAGEGPYTVFAPTDGAFAALPEGTLDTLLDPMNQEQLAGILTYHVVPAEVMAADVTSGEVETVNGATFTVQVSDGTVTITDGQGNEAQVVQTDIVASNGVIHVIDAVLLPPA
ncbi:MAG: fasciclin domain-containing protein [Actinomycetota bacterium]